jgi:hypothetical protein
MDQSILVNAILVQNNLRPAFLVQPINYNEYTIEKREKTNQILSELLEQFPELLHTECSSGIIISKQSYKTEIISTSARLGEILGYPSAKDFEYIINNPDDPDATINIYINTVTESQPIHILANRCKIENIERDQQYFQNIVSEFAKISEIKLIVQIDYTIPIKSLINKLLNNDELTSKDTFEVSNYIWNIGMDKLNEYPFDYTNPLHKGIVLTLLSYCDNDLVSPFYPLQQYPNEMNKVEETTKNWENELLRILGSV